MGCREWRGDRAISPQGPYLVNIFARCQRIGGSLINTTFNAASPSNGVRSLIVVRTVRYGELEQRFVQCLQQQNEVPVVLAVDETRGKVDVKGHQKISITRRVCESIGLHCPIDFTWRNGDYVLYVVRQKFQNFDNYWMIEPDVEHSFSNFGEFIAMFDSAPDLDLLTGYFEPAHREWHWGGSAKRVEGIPYRCFFPLVRLSARAIDVCLDRRKREKFSLRSRLYWPNDEAFIANTILNSGLKAADFNDVGPDVYERESFGYTPLNGDEGAFRSRSNRLYHPVLYGDAYRARVKRQQKATNSLIDRVGRKIQRLL
jgi:hypothetical protein